MTAADLICTYVQIFSTLLETNQTAKLPLRKTKVYPKHKPNPHAASNSKREEGGGRGFVFGTVEASEWTKRVRTRSLEEVHKPLERGLRRTKSNETNAKSDECLPPPPSMNTVCDINAALRQHDAFLDHTFGETPYEDDDVQGFELLITPPSTPTTRSRVEEHECCNAAAPETQDDLVSLASLDFSDDFETHEPAEERDAAAAV